MPEFSFDNIRFNNSELPPKNNNSTRVQTDVDNLTIKGQIVRRYDQDTRFRKHLANWVMWIVPLWLLGVLLILAFNEKWEIKLTPDVLITLLATTTVNVLGLAYIVLKGIFHERTIND